jgi:hypothetical protein
MVRKSLVLCRPKLHACNGYAPSRAVSRPAGELKRSETPKHMRLTGIVAGTRLPLFDLPPHRATISLIRLISRTQNFRRRTKAKSAPSRCAPNSLPGH